MSVPALEPRPTRLVAACSPRRRGLQESPCGGARDSEHRRPLGPVGLLRAGVREPARAGWPSPAAAREAPSASVTITAAAMLWQTWMVNAPAILYLARPCMRHRRSLYVSIMVQFGRLEYFTTLLVRERDRMCTIFCWPGLEPRHFLC